MEALSRNASARENQLPEDMKLALTFNTSFKTQLKIFIYSTAIDRILSTPPPPLSTLYSLPELPASHTHSLWVAFTGPTHWSCKQSFRNLTDFFKKDRTDPTGTSTHSDSIQIEPRITLREAEHQQGSWMMHITDNQWNKQQCKNHVPENFFHLLTGYFIYFICDIEYVWSQITICADISASIYLLLEDYWEFVPQCL